MLVRAQRQLTFRQVVGQLHLVLARISQMQLHHTVRQRIEVQLGELETRFLALAFRLRHLANLADDVAGAFELRADQAKLLHRLRLVAELELEDV